MVTFVAQLIPGFKGAKENLLKLAGVEISISQIQKLSEEVGKAIYEADIQSVQEVYEEPEKHMEEVLDKDKIDTVMYILPDGSAVNTRVQDENGSTWKEMKLGLVFLDKNVIKRGNDSYMITKKDYVSYMGSVDEFKKLLFSAAVNAGYGKVKKVVVIGDGAHWIWNMCQELFPDAECILDFYHMAENVHNYAAALYPNDEKKRTQWAKIIIGYIKTNKFQKALTKIIRSPLPSTASRNTVNLEKYLRNNKDRIRYKDYKEKNYYIGSGMIEGGNKNVIQKRMKQSGMRWSVNGAQYMAVLRAKYESDQWQNVVDFVYSVA